MRSETMQARVLWASMLSVFALVMSGCAGTGGERPLSDGSDIGQTRHSYGDSRTFPVPAELESNVDFWRHVYGVWGRGEVAIHDDEHLDVIYEVVKLPGAVQDSYTATQKSQIESRKHYYTSQLADLEQRVRSNQSLSSVDKELLDKFKRSGGISAVYGASERVRTQRGLRERFRRGVEISGSYDQIFREIMRNQGVPEDLAYLPHVESSFQANARSSVGAGGIWQFMPSTGRQYMTVDRQIDERFDPILAADGAAHYLSQAYRKLGSWPLAITSYNHGQGGMANAKELYGNDIGRIVENYDGKYFGFASRNFYAEFIAAREVAGNPSRYFPEGVRYEEPWLHDRLVLRNSVPADHLARHYGTTKYQLAQLNRHWRDAVLDGKAAIPAGSTIWLPQGTTRRIASQPTPPQRPVLVAKADPRPAPPRTVVAQVSTSTKPVNGSIKAQVAKTNSASQSRTGATKAKYHVVKPQETLYRVAVQNGITVAQLRKLNKMRPEDNHIRTGQKLIVGI
ncbi:lytic transglycosylase domain-containing protein [Thiocystis violacea]|uniref:lytic transglycosylase domain-containing protein n=1 Tax=Thiocystis violacea TaxID=13725 RepID=UPI00190889C8|nr:lytic transglycosylase domain-containing protein [Thiocystis violacea]MBK1723795.1 lytic transglycosylase [Thiocystis violacea]